jgi:hypothetical protein
METKSKSKPRPSFSLRIENGMKELARKQGRDDLKMPELLDIMIRNGFPEPADRTTFENLMSKWRNGEVQKPRDDNALGHVARALGKTYQQLMFGGELGEPKTDEGFVTRRDDGGIVPDGEKVEIDHLEPSQAKVLAAAMAGRKAEVWRLTSDLLAGLSYQPGDFLIVDLAARPKPRDVVLAESLKVPIFRMYAPPYLFGLPLTGHVAPVVVDNFQTAIKGVVSSKLTI